MTKTEIFCRLHEIVHRAQLVATEDSPLYQLLCELDEELVTTLAPSDPLTEEFRVLDLVEGNRERHRPVEYV